ncbi:MAG: hypothetical protein ACI81Q_000310 [Paracoccaceae bacterium]|jgi:hypothetical protein
MEFLIDPLGVIKVIHAVDKPCDKSNQNQFWGFPPDLHNQHLFYLSII